MHRALVIVSALLVLACIAHAVMRPQKIHRWALTYDGAQAAETLAPFDLLVFDRDGHPPLAPLKKQGKILLGYLSLGEAEPYRPLFQSLKERHLLLDNMPPGQGNPIIDGRRAEWHDYVMQEVIPQMLAQGFDGIMIDTLDTIIALERNNAATYGGLTEAAAALIKDIRTRYPSIRIMVNRGFDMLPEIGAYTDMMLAESTYTSWNTAQNEPAMLTREQQQHYLDLIHALLAQYPHLLVFTLDYWPHAETGQVRAIYQRQRDQGFIPYVADYGSQTIIAEPAT